MSIHEAKIIRIEAIEKHPEADKLGLVKVWDWTVVVGLEHWKVGELAVYVEPDTVVSCERPEFEFLKDKEGKTKHRVKVKRLRGIYSQGCLVPAPEGMSEGDNAWDVLGLERYEPEMAGPSFKGIPEKGPVGIVAPTYDLENFAKYNKALEEGEEIYITEKLHGCNARYSYGLDKDTEQERLFCGSRTQWKKEFIDQESKSNSLWHKVANLYPQIEQLLKSWPHYVLYGEIFGQVQDLKYGTKKEELRFAAFDIYDSIDKKWLKPYDMLELCLTWRIPTAPVVYQGPYSKEIVLQYTEGQTTIQGANHTREGCVVKVASERHHPKYGRIALKSVSNAYLEKSK